MQPGSVRYVCRYLSPLGEISLAGDGRTLDALWFSDRKPPFPVADALPGGGNLPAFGAAILWLDIYFSGKDPGFIPPILLKGSDFRKKVWNILLDIPYGHTVTYGEIASACFPGRDGVGLGARAVGGAVGHNPVSLIVPCHRVVGAGGGLTGYAGGLCRKCSLLEMESYL